MAPDVMNALAHKSLFLAICAGAVLPIPDAFAAFKGPAATTHHELVSLEDTFTTPDSSLGMRHVTNTRAASA